MKLKMIFNCTEGLDTPVQLYQDPQTKRFTVTYGQHVVSNLSYAKGAKELGECLLHTLACKGILDNG